MLSRGENGRLSFESLQAEVFFCDLLIHAKNARELEWIGDRLQESLEEAIAMMQSDMGIDDDEEDEDEET